MSESAGPMPRHVAETDPTERKQILSAAQDVFAKRSFDAAGINDIRRAVGVSRSILYAYLAGKEPPFEIIVEQERDRPIADVAAILSHEAPAAGVMRAHGREIARILC